MPYERNPKSSPWTLIGHLAIRTRSLVTAMHIAANIPKNARTYHCGTYEGTAWMTYSLFNEIKEHHGNPN